MNSLLHDSRNTEKILHKIAETLLLINKEGVCVDVISNSNLWFLQKKELLNKNIFELLPLDTAKSIQKTFNKVLSKQQKASLSYQIPIEKDIYSFECTVHPYDNMLLCQYHHIEKRPHNEETPPCSEQAFKDIQKIAQIGQWNYNTYKDAIEYKGYIGKPYAERVTQLSLKNYIELIVEDDKQRFIDWYKRCQIEYATDSIQYRIKFDNKVFYLLHQIYLREKLDDGSFNIKSYVQNITDLQERRNDVNALTNIIDKVKESIFAARRDGTLVFANSSFLEYHDLSQFPNIDQLKIYEIIPSIASLNKWESFCDRAVTDEGVKMIIRNPLTHRKDILAFEVDLYHIIDDHDEPLYWVFAHDISESLRNESQIERLNQIMNTIIDNLPAGIIVKDADNDFQYVLRNKESYLYNHELPDKDSRGKNDFDYYPITIAQRKRKEDQDILATGQSKHFTIEIRDHDDNIYVFDKRKILAKGNGIMPSLIISIEWNITELELMKRELQSAKEKAESSDKLKSAFLANMSHEIRTPLNAIVGFSRLIAESNSMDERKEFYDIVEANNERLLNLINEILDLSKIESGIVEFTIEPVALDNLFKEIYNAHIFRTPENVKLIYEPSPDDVILNTDKNRIFQVMSNLIGNAFKFTVEGSIRFGYYKNDDFVIFYVRDTGLGIEANKIDRVFERFAKMNTFAQGTGLGLSICKTIVERLGGHISVKSEPGIGSQFTFALPTEKPKRTKVLSVNKAQNSINQDTYNNLTVKPKINKRKQTILIVEDIQNNYDLINKFLGTNYQLLHAHDGIEAVTMYEEFKPDLILMDIKMPNLDGLDATKIIRELTNELPIIAQSAYAYDNEKKTALSAGCNDFIAKPFSQNQLNDIVDRWLSSRNLSH